MNRGNANNSGSCNCNGNRPPFGPMDRMENLGINMRNADKCKIVSAVYEIGFVLVETMLYLDTHPDDLEALAYYSEMKEKYENVRKQYNKLVGPLEFTDCSSEKYWTWVATPMPWEMEG